MKTIISTARRSVSALFAVLTFIVLFGAATAARAQSIQPFVDCLERERDNSGALTGKYVAHFGYINYGTTAVFIPTNSASNYLTPVRNPPNQPDTFQPGVHPRVLSVTLDAGVASETWRLGGYYVTATVTTGVVTSSQLCGSDNQNARLITYQGRLSDGSAAANGVYDLQFQLFNAATGGTARTTQITVEDVPVTNGVFTVQLNLGANASINPTGRIQALNAAILSGEDNFFEIGVRPGNSTGAFTTLTPRQPLTAVPLAMRADTANNAVRAAFADNSLQLGGTAANQFIKTDDSRLSDARTPVAGSDNYIQNTTAQQANSNFNVSGNGTVGGTLTANSVKLGASGNLFAVGGEENLRIVRGIFQVNNGVVTIIKGSGFTVTRQGVGVYNVNFTPAFSDFPAVTPSVISGATIIGTSALTNTGVTINAYAPSGNPGDPSYVVFIAVGPK